MCSCNQAIYWYAPDIILCSLFNKYDENGDGQLNEGKGVVGVFTVHYIQMSLIIFSF